MEAEFFATMKNPAVYHQRTDDGSRAPFLKKK
jgi:hypothetical protein